jgi:hypothetical protein
MRFADTLLTILNGSVQRTAAQRTRRTSTGFEITIFPTQLLHENVKTQYRSVSDTIKYKILLSTMKHSVLTSSTMRIQVAGEQVMEMWQEFESISKTFMDKQENRC